MTTNRRWAALGAGVLIAVAGAVAAGGIPPSVRLAHKHGHAAQVTFLEGKAGRTESGAAVETPIKQGDQLLEGDLVATEAKSRIELKLDDNSLLRLGPNARIALTEAQFDGGAQTRKLSVKLFFGNIWAKVTSAVSADQRFAVETENAVAGVRGTTFRVDAHADKSVLVRVYAGAVAVARPVGQRTDEKGARLEVAGPAEVSRDQWEKLVGAQMQISVSAKGVPGEPSPFTDEPADAWAKWNEERDAK